MNDDLVSFQPDVYRFDAPEPSTLALLAAAIVLVLLVRRFHRSHRQP